MPEWVQYHGVYAAWEMHAKLVKFVSEPAHNQDRTWQSPDCWLSTTTLLQAWASTDLAGTCHAKSQELGIHNVELVWTADAVHKHAAAMTSALDDVQGWEPK